MDSTCLRQLFNRNLKVNLVNSFDLIDFNRIFLLVNLQQLKNLKVEYQDGIAVVQFNQENSKVFHIYSSRFSLLIQFRLIHYPKGMMDEFVPLFDHLQNDDKVKGIVVISAKPGSFIAGADIK